MATIRLVPLTEEHLPDLTATFEDRDVLRFTRRPDPMPEGWVQEWRAKFDGHDRAVWAVQDGEEFVGFACTGPVDHVGLEVELGYAVSPWARGRGVATETLCC